MAEAQHTMEAAEADELIGLSRPGGARHPGGALASPRGRASRLRRLRARGPVVSMGGHRLCLLSVRAG
jgi:hypothetical protein